MSQTSILLTPNAPMEFVLVPAGTFEMGQAGEFRVTEPEDPYHFVRITSPFWMGKYPVTRGQWAAIRGEPPCGGTSDWPVDAVSWDDCQDFLKAAGEKGFSLRLPTEAEWEYACRSGTTTRFYWGDADDPALVARFAWTLETSGKTKTIKLPYGKVITVASKELDAVGQKQPNEWGLYDTCGMVWEWCADWFSDGPYRPERPDNPRGPPTGNRRSLRGGCISEGIGRATASARESLAPDVRQPHVGFRCVLAAVNEADRE